MPKYNQYLKIQGSIIFLFVLLGLLNYLFLVQSYEFSSMDEIANLQYKQGGLYSTALRDIIFPYKLSLYKKNKPSIVIMGSSRVLRFRENYFSQPFINMGRAMNSLPEGIMLLKKMLEMHKPEVIILGLDFWWFNPKVKTQHYFPAHNNTGKELTLDTWLSPTKWLWQEKVKINEYIQTISGASPYLYDQDLGYSYGVQAMWGKGGYAKDGSRYDLDLLFGIKKYPQQYGFKNTLNNIEAGTGRFLYSDKIDLTRFKELNQFYELANKNDIKVISFFPPLAKPVFNKMFVDSNNYQFIDEIKVNLNKTGVKYIDLHNPVLVHALDCEFIDGFHIGDLLSLRVLMFMTDRYDFLRKYVSANNKSIALKYSGIAMVPNIYSKHKYTEIDFLNMGCSKTLN